MILDSLNNFELAILERIANDYPFVKSHIPFLIVKNRRKTGVGMYVDFSYKNGSSNYQLIPSNVLALSTDSALKMEGLEFGLVYEIVPANGLIDFLELVTYDGESWDGIIRNFWFE